MNLGKGAQFNPQQNPFIRIHLHVLFFLHIPAMATAKEQLMRTTPADAFISISLVGDTFCAYVTLVTTLLYHMNTRDQDSI